MDYKGMRRPPVKVQGDVANLWDVYEWQVQTYAHLRSSHEDSLPIVAGAVVYLNELMPTSSDLVDLKREIATKQTDVSDPEPQAARALEKWKEGEKLPDLPLDFRMRRALRTVAVTPETVSNSLEAFDHVVARIETCRGKETLGGRVIQSWEKNPSDDSTCSACDSRTYCPSYGEEKKPRLPGAKPKA